MGYHSITYYNRKMKKGNVKKTGYAWWHNQALEDPNNPSHYDDFIPLTVLHDAFGWNAEESVRGSFWFVIGGKEYEVPVKRFKATGRSDWIVNGIPEDEEDGADQILDIVNLEYGTHDPQEVFVKNVAALFDGADNIGCESLGELKWGRRLFASFSIPENLRNAASGFEFRPNLTVVTSYDKTLSTKYVRTFGIPVCDNTLNYELVKAGEENGQFVIRHTKNSAAKLAGAKDALGLLTQQADEMDKWLDEMVSHEVSEPDFIKWLEVMVPVPDPKKTIVKVKSIQGEEFDREELSYRAQTIARNKQMKLMDMWQKDERVAPWANTRLGILQLWNTWNQHEVSVKASKKMGAGDSEESKAAARVTARIEQNMEKMVNGVFTDEDVAALDAITRIQAETVSVPVSQKAAAAAKA